MRDRIKTDTVTALKAGDKARVNVLRLVSAAFQTAEIELRRPLTEADEMQVMTKMVKQRRDSISQFNAGNRPDLSAIEDAEIAVIDTYLPKQMDEAASRAAITSLIADVGAAGPKDMGKVMAALKDKFAGQMDFGKASGWVKDALK